jgi:hypothetical protein
MEPLPTSPFHSHHDAQIFIRAISREVVTPPATKQRAHKINASRGAPAFSAQSGNRNCGEYNHCQGY